MLNAVLLFRDEEAREEAVATLEQTADDVRKGLFLQRGQATRDGVPYPTLYSVDRNMPALRRAIVALRAAGHSFRAVAHAIKAESPGV